MTNVWVMSDLAIDARGEPDLGSDPDHDVVVLAGNVSSRIEETISWAARRFRAPVVCVAGNREYWRRDRLDVVRSARAAASATSGRVSFLENDETSIDGTRFVGATLWTDHALWGEDHVHWVAAHCAGVVPDYRLIRSDGHWSNGWSPEDVERNHRVSVRQIRGMVAGRGRRSVVVTHHAPSSLSLHGSWRADVCAASGASCLDDLVEALGADLWVHGHLIESSDYRIGRTRVICNPLGGIGPHLYNPGFSTGLVVGVARELASVA